jgi:hypothetical protein
VHQSKSENFSDLVALCQSLLHHESAIDSMSQRIGSESGFERIGDWLLGLKAPTYDEIHRSIPETDMSISTAIFVPDTSAELSSCEPDPNGFRLHSDDPDEGIHVDLSLRDRDVVTAINAHPEGRRRADYIRTAIRIGVLALQQAQGRIDTESVRNEGDRLIAALENRLAQYQDQLRSVLGGTLEDYFDPSDGRFTERVEWLIKQDGDLEKVIRTQMDVAAVGLKEAIDNQVGPRSSLAQLLTPGESTFASTRHGKDFEQAAYTFIEDVCQKAGDIQGCSTLST